MSHVMNTYARLPVAFERGEGAWLWDTQGKRYLDALAGIAVCGVGHSHPRLTAVLREQLGRLVHTSNLYEITLQERLADRLAQLSGMDSVFFCNSGCEANEAAIKLARYYGHQKNIEAPAIVVMEKAFHGRTIATLSATGSRKVQAGFEPLVAGFVRVPFDDLDAARRVAESNRSVVAVMVELIQGEGGINVCHPGYLRGLREICNERGDGEGGERYRRPEADARRKPHRGVHAEHVQRAVREVDDAGDAEDQRQAGGDEEERARAGEPVQELQQNGGTTHSLRSLRTSSSEGWKFAPSA
jgi:hypothetical protein